MVLSRNSDAISATVAVSRDGGSDLASETCIMWVRKSLVAASLLLYFASLSNITAIFTSEK